MPNGNKEYTKLIAAIIVAMAGSTGINVGINKATPEARYEPWTSTQDQYTMDNFDKKWDKRVNRNETIIMSNQKSVWKALSNDGECRAELKHIVRRLDVLERATGTYK